MAKKKTDITFFVKKGIQDFAKQHNMMVGSDSYDAVNEKIHEMLLAAVERCKANGRKTLKAYDL
ncbi:MAG: DUF1931 domain-containing protein [Candidatus Lokiarchaeota archaeon]|nr:DUF1931 domain-containing protein [Candidatus Lokiarchaeota archaeon]